MPKHKYLRCSSVENSSIKLIFRQNRRAPNLLVWFEEVPKQILCSLITQYFLYFLIYREKT